MPVFNFFHWSKDHGHTLAETGPLVSVEVSVPQALKEHFSQKGLAIPPPQSGFALIDTGAFNTAVDQSIFDALGTPAIDTITTYTPHGEGKSPVYPASVSFPGMAVTDMPMERIIGCSLKWATRDGREIIMLMGRDLLQYFLLVYNGPGSDITLAY
jgi:hypothetical protein